MRLRPSFAKLTTTLLILLGASFAVGNVARAQFGPGGAGTAERLGIEIKSSRSAATPGSSLRMAAIITIEHSWHINAHRPSEDYLIGTTFSLEPREEIILADVQYPDGKLMEFGFSETPLLVYEDIAPVFFLLRISDQIQPGTYVLKGTIEAQACNDQVCLAPSEIPFEIPLTIASDPASIVSENDQLFAGYDPGASIAAATPGNELANLFETEGSLTAFLAIFLIGLALNLTPCVYPMLSVTVSLFGAQKETRTGIVFAKAVVYVLGIASMYSVLGVTAALSGGLFGSWLQSPWVLAGIGVLLFGLALSMFGLYQLQVPYWITSKLGGTTGTGIVSLYVSGLVVGVFAAPCIGPPVIALLALVGAKGDPLFGFWSFFVLSLGLGLPYLILGTFSGLLTKIPRSGDWLIWVERIFGVVLSGAALFYVSLAFAPKLAPFVVPFVLIVGGIYLGFLESSGKGKKILRIIKLAFGLAAVSFGLVLANALREPGVTWDEYDTEWLNEARLSKRPVVIDFYADWCIPCIELDRRTFTDGKVIDALDDFVRLKVDLTHFDSPESEFIRKEFGIAGVPTIVFLNRAGDEVKSARFSGYMPPKDFLERVELAQ